MPERPPTSHEQRAGASWDASYRGGPAPWDIDRPQPAIARLAEAGAFTGAVLDAGCGTGEHALLLAARGLPVLGIDVAPTAIARAREKAAARGLDVEFQVGDALHLSGAFDTVLDCGLFHTFDADERRAYVASLAAVTRGRLFVLCFGEADVPHPVTEAELRAAFTDGWHIAVARPRRDSHPLRPGRRPRLAGHDRAVRADVIGWSPWAISTSVRSTHSRSTVTAR